MGKFTTTDLEKGAKQNTPTDSQYHPRPRPSRSRARRYIKIVNKKKSPERTSRRSVTQATDSTRRGWIANTRAATPADAVSACPRSEGAGRARVRIRRTMKKKTTAFAACRRRLVRW